MGKKKGFIAKLNYSTSKVPVRRPEWDLNPDLCDSSAVLYQLSCQANWEQVIIWVHDKPIDDEYTSMHEFRVFIHITHTHTHIYVCMYVYIYIYIYYIYDIFHCFLFLCATPLTL